ncbi:FAD-dependent oxidoreductase [Streptomyces sp. NPDC048291]|uniref:FAD-dependent oxidoreductase n=1 Tax=Streptomyces sp. NPDC048291 TaxID=3365530 RepID=UPI00371F3D45
MTDEATTADWDEECDVLVVGSGGGGLTGAYTAAALGLDTLVVEKTGYYGGTTAYAGACLWLPGNPAQARAGLEDSAELGRTYFRAVVGDSAPAELQDAYIDNAGPMVAFLEENPEIRFEHRPFPDYYDAPGRFPLGRGVFPVEYPAAGPGDELLGAVRPTAWEERLGVSGPEGPFTDGRALIAALLSALRATGRARCRLGSALTDLVTGPDGAVLGARVTADDGRERRVRARRGVLLAAGGFEASHRLRREWQHLPGADWTMGAPGGNTGDAILAGQAAGADTALLAESWWCPSVLFPDGSANFALGFRGGVFVGADGRRFANESLPYDRMGRAMLAAGHGDHPDRPVWWVFDGRWGDEVPGIVVVPADRKSFTEAGLWHTADTLDGLAATVGIDPVGLTETVRTFNGYAAEGVDADFHRGEDPYDAFFADGEGPNSALVSVAQGPFHAVRLVLGDLGTKGGLRTDIDARVLRADGTSIPGLYATGNTIASAAGAFYPGPGAPIGSAMVFGHLAARDMAGRAG